MRVCLVSRELYPYAGGGIAPIVAATARELLPIADEVVVVTSNAYRTQHEKLLAAADRRLLPPEVTLLWAEEPKDSEHGAAYSHMHAYSANVHDVLCRHYGDDGPDLLEFPDYLGEGFVTMQARHTSASWLRNTLVCVRLHTTSEMCAVLDGRVPDDFTTRAIFDAERYALRHADRLLWSGGDVYDSYARYYGAAELAPGTCIRDAFLVDEDPVAPPEERVPLEGTDRHVRLLFVGRMERRKGVQNLLRALDRLGPRGDWSLTLLGGDTDTGPTGTSLKDNLQAGFDGDSRITFARPVPRAEVGALISHHDVVVIPSLWECWPNVGRETLMVGRPLLVTPVGGLVDMAVPGRSGWVADGIEPEDLVAALERLLDDRDAIDTLIAGGGPEERFAELTDADALRTAYTGLVADAPRRRVRPRRAPGDRGVSVVVPYFKLEAHVEETLASILDQTYPYIETIVVNDGSLREQDRLLYDLADAGKIKLLTQPNSGLGQARNAGVRVATGAYVLPLDADDTIAPTFVERCVEALEGDATMAYATTWAQFMDPSGAPFGEELGGYMPFGNWSPLIHEVNVGGTCSAVFCKWVFERGNHYSADLVSYEDWLLFWELHDDGLTGAIIPERLFNYRVRARSMMRQDGAPLTATIHDEVRARARERQMRWTRSQ